MTPDDVIQYFSDSTHVNRLDMLVNQLRNMYQADLSMYDAYEHELLMEDEQATREWIRSMEALNSNHR